MKKGILSTVYLALLLLLAVNCSKDELKGPQDTGDLQLKATSLVNNGIYEIEFQTNSDKVLDLRWGEDANGAVLRPWDRLGGTAQQWIAIDAGNGYWRFVSKASASGRCIDLENGNASNGSSIRLWDNYGNDAQAWLVTSLGNDYFKIVSKINTSKSWDVPNCIVDGSENMQLWDYYGTSCQVYKFNYIGMNGGSGSGACDIDGNTSYQAIDGIGFSSAWCGTLTTAKNDALYNTLGFSLLRVRFDQNNYWDDERNNATAAHARGAKVLGCPWMIPGSMKTGTTPPYTLREDQYSNYCNWLKDAANYINCDYVSIKNEPDMSNSVDGNLSGEQIRVLCRYYIGVVGKPIVVADAVGFSDSYTDPTLNDAEAVNNISYVSGHLYGGGLYTHQNALNKGKHVWQTEYYVSNSRDDINNSIVQAVLIQDCMDNMFSAYFYWWVYDADASVNLVNQSGTIYKAGYVAGQFAKWIRPGKTRIGCTYKPSSNIYVTAYRGGGIVVVAVNEGYSSVNQTFNFSNISGLTTLNVHRTSGSENMASLGSVTLSGDSFTYTLPAKSVTTFHQF